MRGELIALHQPEVLRNTELDNEPDYYDRIIDKLEEADLGTPRLDIHEVRAEVDEVYQRVDEQRLASSLAEATLEDRKAIIKLETPKARPFLDGFKMFARVTRSEKLSHIARRVEGTLTFAQARESERSWLNPRLKGWYQRPVRINIRNAKIAQYEQNIERKVRDVVPEVDHDTVRIAMHGAQQRGMSGYHRAKAWRRKYAPTSHVARTANRQATRVIAHRLHEANDGVKLDHHGQRIVPDFENAN